MDQICKINKKTDNYILDQVENYTYPSSATNQERRCTMEVKSRIEQVKFAFINEKKFLCFINITSQIERKTIEW